jgi:hypothetical protein
MLSAEAASQPAADVAAPFYNPMVHLCIATMKHYRKQIPNDDLK